MRALLILSSAALALAACNSNHAANNDMNATALNATTATDNMMVDQNGAMTGGMDGNMATNAATENAMVNDMTHNDADTNLANGM